MASNLSDDDDESESFLTRSTTSTLADVVDPGIFDHALLIEHTKCPRDWITIAEEKGNTGIHQIARVVRTLGLSIWNNSAVLRAHVHYIPIIFAYIFVLISSLSIYLSFPTQIAEACKYDRKTALSHDLPFGTVSKLEDLLKKKSFPVDAGSMLYRGTGHFAASHVAASLGQYDVLKCLLENGASANARDIAQWTPLHYAANAVAPKCVKLLLEHKAEADVIAEPRFDKQTPLHRLAAGAAFNTVDLLERINTLDIGYHHDLRCTFEAREKANIARAAATAARAAADAEAAALREAAEQKSASAAENEDAQPKLESQLELAAKTAEANAVQAEEIAKLAETRFTRFLPSARDLHKKPDKLKEAFQECFKLLLDAKGDLETADLSGRLPLHLAACSGRVQALEYLLAIYFASEPNEKDQNTPLHYACMFDHPEAVTMLIKAGADKNAKNAAGQTPADLAFSKEVKEALKLEPPAEGSAASSEGSGENDRESCQCTIA